MSLFRLCTTTFPGGFTSTSDYCHNYEQACELVFKQTRRNPTWETWAEAKGTGTVIMMVNMHPDIKQKLEKLQTTKFLTSVLNKEDLAKEDLAE